MQIRLMTRGLLKMPALALLHESLGEKQETANLCHRILVFGDPRSVCLGKPFFSLKSRLSTLDDSPVYEMNLSDKNTDTWM